MKSFSLERANALIPRVAPLVRDLLAKRRDLAIALLERRTAGEVGLHSSRLAGVRAPFPAPRYGERKSEIVRLIHRIEGFGCIVKDIDLGLLDFPSARGDEPVYLCWKSGEERIAHWHGIDEGFPMRKPIDAAFGEGL